MSKVNDQWKFLLKVADLIKEAERRGYQLTLGDGYRDPRVHGEFGQPGGYGAANSFHKLRLAIDFNLFKDGVFLQGTDAHRELGEWWESQGGTWGGRWRDGNHYSMGEGK